MDRVGRERVLDAEPLEQSAGAAVADGDLGLPAQQRDERGAARRASTARTPDSPTELSTLIAPALRGWSSSDGM